MHKTNVFWNDLKQLENIIDDVKAKNFDNKNIEDLKESIFLFIEEFLENNIRIYEQYDFLECLYVNVHNIIINTYGHGLLDSFSVSLETIIDESIHLYFLMNDNPRSFPKTLILKNPDKKHVKNVFKKVKKKEQPDQRTDEWYLFRWNLLTASSIWKAIDSQAMQNSIIYDKCKPIDTKKFSTVNIDSPFHKGHKYEPLSTMMYEYLYDTKVGEFGCIKHDTYTFIGASPDGINIDETNIRYGRLLEIKNPFSDRKINGIPKKEYWIQMQIQMEVWDLDECDFLETRFKEYNNEQEFEQDGDTFNKTKNNQYKGILLQFFHNNEPHYEYAPFNCSREEYKKWNTEIMKTNSYMTWVKNVYWYLDYYNCSLVTRNKKWFKAVVPQFQKIWDTIVEERETGFEHRKPRKKSLNTTNSTTVSCKIKLNNSDSDSDNNSDNDNETKKEKNNTLNNSTQLVNKDNKPKKVYKRKSNHVIKIDI